jgi:hypothetical protein
VGKRTTIVYLRDDETAFLNVDVEVFAKVSLEQLENHHLYGARSRNLGERRAPSEAVSFRGMPGAGSDSRTLSDLCVLCG